MGPKVVTEMLFYFGCFLIIVGICSVIFVPDLLWGLSMLTSGLVGGLFYLFISSVLHVLINIERRLNEMN
ncbi:hypothetical protein BBEV_3117 [Salisediminibacterium beveridgei]|uniref:Uncharacterized protein n=1 Tax=Salisediminibacterium beveridgei TaxID=632773 RepID=A0A1D7QZJ1_9BACI|nr:hypothetical protein BBEV_3117 [Salisediminibacterium beveridgei]